MFSEDEALLRNTNGDKRWPWAILDSSKEMLLRPAPNLFTVHKVGFGWVIWRCGLAVLFGCVIWLCDLVV